MNDDKTSASSPASRGLTSPAQGERQEAVPRTPAERDESADAVQPHPAQQEKAAQAARDLERGLQDTDRGNLTDAVYDKVREGSSQPDTQTSDPIVKRVP